MPKFRNLWEHIRKDMPKKGRGKTSNLDPLQIPVTLQTALEALYGHYKEDLRSLAGGGHRGAALFHRRLQQHVHLEADLRLHRRLPPREPGRLHDAGERSASSCSSNFDDHGNAIARPRTLLIDSEQLESGEALDRNFRAMAADEIDRFRKRDRRAYRRSEARAKLVRP